MLWTVRRIYIDKMRTFKRFIREQEEQSGETPDSLRIDPSHQALVLKIARSIIDQRKKGNEELDINALRELEKSGVSPSKIADAIADARRQLKKNPIYGGPHHKLAAEYQRLNQPPPGENLDTEA